MRIQDIIHIDKEIQNGQPVFVGTRVPVDSLFDHLEAGISLDEFLEDFPVKANMLLSLSVLNIKGCRPLQ